MSLLTFGSQRIDELKRIFSHIFRLLFLGFLAFGINSYALAQFTELEPIQRVKFSPTNGKSNARVLNQNSIPFWDDFSRGLDTTNWSISGITFSESVGNNPPSIGMVLFNGVDKNGRQYSLQVRDQGESDYLTSKPFDLSQLDANAKSSLFLSFFWQAGGKSEAPDDNDQFILQVLNPEGLWITVWSQKGGEERDRENFTQEIIQILPEWQHQNFQFRFFSEGRQSGPFDSWILDYIYLNSGRTNTNLNFPDRALTSSNQVLLGDFQGFPRELLESTQLGNWTLIENEFLNLENRFRAMEFTISLQDSLGSILLPINSNTPFNPVPNALERRTFLSREFEEIPVPAEDTKVYFVTSLTSGDGPLMTINNGDTTRFSQVNFAQNDTVKTTFAIRDYFAYDQDIADYAAGINQRSGSLAVKFKTPEPVYIKGISINFSNASQANQAIDIQVWKELDQKPIFTQENLIPVKVPGQDFIYYALDTNLQVSDEFYIGFTQFTNNFIHVGLDKTNDQSDKIFYNVGGGWVQNEEVKGSLQIRPHVSLAEPFEESALPEASFRIYPNPIVNLLTIEGEFIELSIFDSFGRQILLSTESSDEGEIINFGGQKPGIYLVNLLTKSGVKTFRVQVK